MTDIVDRLRDCENYEDQWQLRQEAADEITGLRNALGNAGLVIEKLSRELAEFERADEEHDRIARDAADARRQLAECERERGAWKSEALDHCEKVVKQAKATLSDRHYMRVMDEQLSELTNFVQRIASLPSHGEYVSLIDEAKDALAKLGADKKGEV